MPLNNGCLSGVFHNRRSRRLDTRKRAKERQGEVRGISCSTCFLSLVLLGVRGLPRKTCKRFPLTTEGRKRISRVEGFYPLQRYGIGNMCQHVSPIRRLLSSEKNHELHSWQEPQLCTDIKMSVQSCSYPTGFLVKGLTFLQEQKISQVASVARGVLRTTKIH